MIISFHNSALNFYNSLLQHDVPDLLLNLAALRHIPLFEDCNAPDGVLYYIYQFFNKVQILF